MKIFTAEDRSKAYFKAFGWQGGTIHQVAKETGVDVQSLLYADAKVKSSNSDYNGGWFAGRTCSVEHNKAVNFPKNHGNKDFWVGVAEGIADNVPTVTIEENPQSSHDSFFVIALNADAKDWFWDKLIAYSHIYQVAESKYLVKVRAHWYEKESVLASFEDKIKERFGL